MAFDEGLAERVDRHLGEREGVTDRKMFGGIAWMLNGNMAVGVLGDELIVRLGDERGETALAEPGTRPFDLTGRAMKAFVMVRVGDDDAALATWVDRGVSYAESLPPK